METNEPIVKPVPFSEALECSKHPNSFYHPQLTCALCDNEKGANEIPESVKQLRLAFQSKEEEIKDLHSGLKYKDDIIHEMDMTIDTNEEQLKAKDDELAKLKNHLKNCLKQPIAAIGNIDYQKGYKQATSDLLGILPSFLSQSTDKP